MPRFSAVFPRRKSTAPDELLSAEPTAPEQSSFRVLERNTFSDGRSFDGGARLSRSSGNILPNVQQNHHIQHKPRHSELDVEDNMFAGLNVNRRRQRTQPLIDKSVDSKPWPELQETNNVRASGASNTTKATSTDASSRHSNASTAPSSADMTTVHEDGRGGPRKPNNEPASKQSSKSSGPSLLDRAGRTFSFGIQRKHNAAPPKQDAVPDVPPLPTFQRQDEYGRTRGMTTSTTSTETAPTLHEGSDMDMGGDFGSMFTSFDKRSSTATLKNDRSGERNLTQRPSQPAPLHLDHGSAISPPLVSAESQRSDDALLGPTPAFASSRNRSLPPVPRHQPSFEYRSSLGPSGEVQDNDAKFLSDSLAAGKFLSMSGPSDSARYQSEDNFTAVARKPLSPPVSSTSQNEENMFEGTVPRFARSTYRGGNQPNSPKEGNKVMTPAQFERYRQDKEREGYERANKSSNSDDDEDEDDINYDDDDEDEDEKMKRQARERRDQQAHMAAYRQQRMKTTGQPARTTPSPNSQSRPNLGSSLSAPHLGLSKTPSPEPVRYGPQEDDEEDEDVPLAILQAHGFPHKARAPSRLSVAGSNPNLRATAQAQPKHGDPPTTNAQRSSTLPAFARGLPQDPFVGAGISRPAVRESLSFAGGAPAPGGLAPPQVQQPQGQPVHPGGLVGVIANEERSRAMRRGSPNMDARGLAGGIPGSLPIDPLAALNPNMMYGQGMPTGFHQMPQQLPQQQTVSAGDQVQLQMSQQMQQFMQMQMQFMQMMAANQNGGQQMQQQQQFQQQPPPPPPHHPYGGYAASQSVGDFSSAQSISGNMAPRRLDAGMRTMSMIQPSTGSPMLPMPSGFGNHGQGPGSVYTPSIAPSERSNVGLPGRYRPVSQASGAFASGVHQRSQTMSGAFSSADDLKTKSTIKVVGMTKSSSDEDDDEEGWEAMRAKRDQKKSKWRFRKEADFSF